MNFLQKKEGFQGQKSYIMPSFTLKKAMNHQLCKGLYITDIGYYPNAEFHSRERKNGCQQYVLIYCVKGEGWYKVNNEKYSLKENQIGILPPNVAHKYGADAFNPWSIYWIHFAGENAAAIVNHLQKNNDYSPINTYVDEGRNILFNKLISYLEMADNMNNMVDAFLSFPHYLTTFKLSAIKENKLNFDYNPIAESIAYMKSKLNTMVTLKELAENVSLSVSHYSSLFQQMTHKSPINYFLFLKMQHACLYLENTKLSIKQISVELGYDDPFHFSRIFKNVIGISPKGFRNR